MAISKVLSSYVVVWLKDGRIGQIPMVAQPVAQYALIDASTGKSPQGLLIKPKGNSLLIAQEDSGDVLVELSGFYISGATAAAINENSGADQVICAATSTENGDIANGNATYSLACAVTLTDNPNFQSKQSYSFSVVATDAAGNSNQQTVTLGVNHLSPSVTLQSLPSPMMLEAINQSNGGDYDPQITAFGSDGDFICKDSFTGSNANGVDLWNGSWTVNANPNHEHIGINMTNFAQVYQANMPSGILTSQGLV